MNAKEIRMYILDLQDQHCAACEHRTNQSPKYCLENCQVGEELYRLGKKLAPGVGQVRENPKRKNWERIDAQNSRDVTKRNSDVCNCYRDKL
ncbi:zinc-finger domain-containing protein [Bacillus cereus]